MSRREYISANCGCRFIARDEGFSALTTATVQRTVVTTTDVNEPGSSTQAGTTDSGSSVIATSERLDNIDTSPGSPAEVTDGLDYINLLPGGLALIHQYNPSREQRAVQDDTNNALHPYFGDNQYPPNTESASFQQRQEWLRTAYNPGHDPIRDASITPQQPEPNVRPATPPSPKPPATRLRAFQPFMRNRLSSAFSRGRNTPSRSN